MDFVEAKLGPDFEYIINSYKPLYVTPEFNDIDDIFSYEALFFDKLHSFYNNQIELFNDTYNLRSFEEFEPVILRIIRSHIDAELMDGDDEMKIIIDPKSL